MTESEDLRVNKFTRVKMVRAMEFIARQINDEDIFDSWLMFGVADGDDLNDDEYISYCYCDDKTFAELMDCFLRLMARAYRSGGLYCDDVVSDREK